VLKRIKNNIEFFLKKREWKNKNKHNSTWMINDFCIECVRIGVETYGGLTVYNDVDNVKLVIGNYCSIAEKVVFLLGLEHCLVYVSTFPFAKKILEKGKTEAVSKGSIIIGDDVWIGYGTIILSGVHIGQGAVIGAGAVVSSDIPPYAIACGAPAKVIKYRFSSGFIKELMKIDYGKINRDMIKRHVGDLYQKLTDINQVNWMPKKDK
jgi:virginiamycin A acetyltransferase